MKQVSSKYEVTISKKLYVDARGEKEAKDVALWEFYDGIEKDVKFFLDIVKVKRIW